MYHYCSNFNPTTSLHIVLYSTRVSPIQTECTNR